MLNTDNSATKMFIYFQRTLEITNQLKYLHILILLQALNNLKRPKRNRLNLFLKQNNHKDMKKYKLDFQLRRKNLYLQHKYIRIKKKAYLIRMWNIWAQLRKYSLIYHSINKAKLSSPKLKELKKWINLSLNYWRLKKNLNGFFKLYKIVNWKTGYCLEHQIILSDSNFSRIIVMREKLKTFNVKQLHKC